MIFVLNLLSSRHRTLTTDEPRHHRYGMNILELHSDRFDDSKMPFTAFNAVPQKAASLPAPAKVRAFLADMRTGGIVTMLFSLALAYQIFHWTRSLYGFFPGLFALTLYAFDPNFLAHSQLITTDVYAAGMVTVSTYTFWRFSHMRDWKSAGLSAAVLGLAQLAKYTCIFLYPLFVAVLLVRELPRWLRFIKSSDMKGLRVYLRRGIQFGLLYIVVSLLIINAGFLFNRSFTLLGDYHFKSDLFRALQARLSWLPVPLPYPYLEGLDLVRFGERSGAGLWFGTPYLLGELRPEGFNGYFFYASLYKVPIATQLAVLISAGAYLLRRKRFRFRENELFLLAPVLFYSIYFNFFFRAQMGIRFFLVVFPFLYVFCGSLVRGVEAFSPGKRLGVAALLSYLIISVLSYHPHFLSYFNERVWDRRLAYKFLADSNLDWEQSKWYLERYLQKHPEAWYEPPFPVAGKVVVSVNQLTGIADPRKYQWLREHFEPTDTIAYSYLVYEVSPEQLHQFW
jgi:hypothetical protein